MFIGLLNVYKCLLCLLGIRKIINCKSLSTTNQASAKVNKYTTVGRNKVLYVKKIEGCPVITPGILCRIICVEFLILLC